MTPGDHIVLSKVINLAGWFFVTVPGILVLLDQYGAYRRKKQAQADQVKDHRKRGNPEAAQALAASRLKFAENLSDIVGRFRPGHFISIILGTILALSAALYDLILTWNTPPPST